MNARKISLGEYVPTADQRVITYASWQQFERQLELRGDVAGPRISFLDGALELMSPSRYHEGLRSVIGRLLEVYALEQGLDMSALGSWTLKAEALKIGVEPDECYVIGDQEKDRPDLAIEVVWTSGGLDKLEIYRRLGVSEVWHWEKGVLSVHVLRGQAYVHSARSKLFPGLDMRLLASFIDAPTMMQAVRGFRDALRAPSKKRRGPVRSKRRTRA